MRCTNPRTHLMGAVRARPVVSVDNYSHWRRRRRDRRSVLARLIHDPYQTQASTDRQYGECLIILHTESLALKTDRRIMYDEIDRSRERETKARKHRRLATAKPAAHHAHRPPPRIGKEEAASKSKLFTKKR